MLKRKAGAGLLVAIFGRGLSAHAAQDSLNRLTVAEVKEHRGETATLCGRPAGFVCSEAGTAFNFLAPDRSLVQVFVPKASRQQFGPRLEDRFAQRNVCATGKIDPLGSRDQIVVSSPDLLVLDSGQSPPAPAFGPMAYRPDCDPGVRSPR